MTKVKEIFYYQLLAPVVTAFDIEDLFRYRRGEVRTIPSDLHSIVSCHDLPLAGHDFGITFHHASFGDFLLDGCRSRNFFIDLRYARLTLVKAAIHHMKTTDDGAKPSMPNISRLFHCARLRRLLRRKTDVFEELAHAFFIQNFQEAYVDHELLEQLYRVDLVSYCAHFEALRQFPIPQIFGWLQQQVSLLFSPVASN